MLVNIIPEEWKQVFLYAEYREGYKKVFFYYYPETRVKPVYSLDKTDLFNIDEDGFDELENELSEIDKSVKATGKLSFTIKNGKYID